MRINQTVVRIWNLFQWKTKFVILLQKKKGVNHFNLRDFVHKMVLSVPVKCGNSKNGSGQNIRSQFQVVRLIIKENLSLVQRR